MRRIAGPTAGYLWLASGAGLAMFYIMVTVLARHPPVRVLYDGRRDQKQSAGLGGHGKGSPRT